MKIVHTCLCGPMTDGLNYQENVLTKYHRRMGFEVTIIASQYEWNHEGKMAFTDRSDYRNSDDVKVIRLPVKRGTVNSRMKVYPALYKTIEAEQPDILFIHNCQFPDILTLAHYAKKHPDVRVYVDNHVDYSNGVHGWLSKNILHKGLWRFCVHQIEPYVTRFYGVLPTRVDILKELYALPAEKCRLLVMGGDDEMVQRAAQPEVRSRIRAQYGIAEDDFLIMTGGVGCGNIAALCDGLLTDDSSDFLALVLTGKNDKLREELTARYAGDHRVQAVPFTREVNLYMNASDVLITKPGGLSSTEAAAACIPMIHLITIPGCEEKNAAFYESHGMARKTTSLREAASLAVALAGDPAACEAMRKQQAEQINANSAQDIARFVLCANANDD